MRFGFAASFVLIIGLASLTVMLALNRSPGTFIGTQMPVFELKGTADYPKATALVVSSTNGENGAFVVDGLHPLSNGRVYELWLQKNHEAVSGAVFTVDHEGYATLIVHAPRPLTDYSEFYVTIERSRGGRQPSGPRVLQI